MWSVTGHCAYAGEHDEWQTGCGKCCPLHNYPPIRIDTARFLWNQKKRLYAKCRITVVAPSSWTEAIARKSPLFANAEILRIPYGLELGVFRPHDKADSRHQLGIPLSATVALFAANEVSDTSRKGADEAMAALRAVSSKLDLHVALAGIGGGKWKGTIEQRIIDLGYLRSDEMMARAYSAADFLIVPSMHENLPNTLLEAMACGTPAVAYDTGGIRDALIDGTTGILVPRGDRPALAAAISEMAGHPDARTRMGGAALDLIQREFSADLQAQRFEKLYLRLISS
jgi:glycosyltransferase involved in cell wall biosynthesis